MMRQWDSWTNGSYSHVFVAQMNDGMVGNAVDLLKDEHYDSPLKPNGGDEEISISPDGKLIAYTCKNLVNGIMHLQLIQIFSYTM
ncbi:MAG: PD40 domain-containing protein [Bacteroidetes bacterium]|nr:PD40 domain-containing protein [Bacteroidota bacterium]